ncbi:MAG: sulfotransferase [Myxococcota bacterium]
MDQAQLHRLRALAPVFIWAPTQRCGTGLLQRLVTSSREALIFGEESHLTLEIPRSLIRCARQAEKNDVLLRRLSGGDPSGWYVHVYPPSKSYHAALIDNFYTLAEVYDQSARELGFRRWGTKFPGIHPQELLVLAKLLPHARHLIVFRDLVDVLRSVKSRGWVNRPADAMAYCTHWTNRLAAAMDHFSGDPRFRMIRYEQLVGDPQMQATEIASFLSLSTVDVSVFSHRPNAPGDGYTPPTALTPRERQMIDDVAGSLRAKLGYPRLLAA